MHAVERFRHPLAASLPACPASDTLSVLHARYFVALVARSHLMMSDAEPLDRSMLSRDLVRISALLGEAGLASLCEITQRLLDQLSALDESVIQHRIAQLHSEIVSASLESRALIRRADRH